MALAQIDEDKKKEVAKEEVKAPGEPPSLSALKTMKMGPQQRAEALAVVQKAGVPVEVATNPAVASGAEQILKGAAKVAELKIDPAKENPDILKLLGGGTPSTEKTPEIMGQKVMASAILNALPLIAGYLIGGNRGGAIGAAAGGQAYAAYDAQNTKAEDEAKAQANEIKKKVLDYRIDVALIPEKAKYQMAQALALEAVKGDQRAQEALVKLGYDKARQEAEFGLKQQLQESEQKFKSTESEKERAFKAQQAKEKSTEKAAKPKEFKPNQLQAASYARMMIGAESSLDALEKSGFDRTSAKIGAQSLSPTNALKSNELIKAEQAEKQFLQAVLRKQSGAAISASEYATEGPKYFPRFGDDKETIEQKRAARAQAIEGLKAEAGGAMEAVKQITVRPVQQQQQQQHESKGAPVLKKSKSTGELWLVYPDGHKEPAPKE